MEDSSRNIIILSKADDSILTYLAQKGYNLIQLSDINKPNKAIDLYTNSYKIDFSSKESTFAQLTEIDIKDPVAIVAIYEKDVLHRSWVGEYYNLNVLAEEEALIVSDKNLMRQKFIAYDKSITPNFRLVKSWEDVASFAADYGYPLILKPTNLAKSLLVTKSNSLAELEENYRQTKDQIADVYKKTGVVNRDANIIIEEFMLGSFHSVQLFLDNSGRVQETPGVVDLVMGSEIGYDDNFIFSRELPSRLTKEDGERLLEVAAKGAKALGLKNSPAHVEIVFTKTGPQIIEIGARMGGYRDYMYEAVYGIHLYRKEVEMQMGIYNDFNPEFKNYCIVYELFPKKEGILKSIKNIEKLKGESGVDSLQIYDRIGKKVGLSKQGYKAVVIAKISTDDKKQYERLKTIVENDISFELS